jgi:hypothetical protein
MSYASQSGRARTSSRRPEAHAICDRCGFRYNHQDLAFQYEWRGATLQNIRILVCRRCLDVPQENIRSIVLPADPMPIMNPRVQDFVAASTDYRTVSDGTVIDPHTGIPIPSKVLLVTEDCQNVTTEPYGLPTGFDQNAIMPYNGGVQQAFGTPLEVLSVTANGSCTVSVTCSAVHNLRQQNNPQVSVKGLSFGPANGFYSVTVLSATAFSYQTYRPIPAGGLLTPTARIVTLLIGVPYGYQQIPQVGLDAQGVATVNRYLETESDVVITTESGMPIEIE